MVKSFQSVLSPLLIISFMCGLKIWDFPTGHPKQCSLFYIVSLWSIYSLLLIYIIPQFLMVYYITLYLIFYLLNLFIMLMSLTLIVYHDKKFRKCIKRIATVDDTLKQLEITTNYQKLRKKTVWFILGWLVMIILFNYVEALWMKHQHNLSTIIIICVPCIQNYCIHVNCIDDLIFISILGYIELKFDQINENLRKIIKNGHGITPVEENRVSQSRQRRLLRTSSNKHMLWIIIHLHSELCQISREVNSIFGLQMVLKMGLYFGLITVCLNGIFNINEILIKNYTNQRMEFLFLMMIWIVLNILKVYFINYTCEKVSAKANTTGSILNDASYSTCDVEICENILQLLLQLTQAPLKLYGLGLFQFGFKCLQGFVTSIATVLTILTQVHINKTALIEM